MLEVNKQYKRNSDVIIKNVGKTFVALNTETGSEYKINVVSYDMLDILADEMSVQELITKMLEIYDSSTDVIVSDCENWIPEALMKGLIVEAK